MGSMSDQQTIEYYNTNVREYRERTVHADMSMHRRLFLQRLSPSAYILDAGCGPGRDMWFFHTLGYEVLGLDPAKEMVRYVKEELHLPAVNGMLQDIHYVEEFDGIWASASLVHVPLDALGSVFHNLWTALKSGGVLFISFKEGTGVRTEGERTFLYMTKETLQFHLLGFTVIEQWIHIPEEGVSLTPCRWLNTILRKEPR